MIRSDGYTKSRLNPDIVIKTANKVEKAQAYRTFAAHAPFLPYYHSPQNPTEKFYS